jgi:hypothetical protein
MVNVTPSENKKGMLLRRHYSLFITLTQKRN